MGSKYSGSDLQGKGDDLPTTLTVWDLWTDPVGVAALLDVWGRSWAGPERGSEILCVLTHGMGSTPPPPPHHHQGDDLELQLLWSCEVSEHGMKVVERVFEKMLCRIMSVDEMQFDFMPERGTIDVVFILCRMQEVYHAEGKK